MFKKIRHSIDLVRNMGTRYLLFRAKHELLMRSGLMKGRFPVNPPKISLPSTKDWQAGSARFFFSDKNDIQLPRRPTPALEKKFNNICSGKLVFFNSILFDLEDHYDWVTNPDNGYKYDIKAHWTQIPDFSNQAGDIKYVWEKSRFSFLYDIIRYDYHFNHDCSKLVLDEILSWINHNPVNCGPNYRCGQEITLRVLNWTFALHYYKYSPHLTDDVFEKVMFSIYWQMKHVYDNINFSRIAVRNNHAITETLGLYLVGLLFPFYPGADKWKQKGKKWFEQEIAYQVYPDGTFLQFSMNYHRVVVQLLTWAIKLSELNGIQLHHVVEERATASLRFLHNCMNVKDGFLPNYGANDGALFFPFNDNDFRDYRPQLHALSAMLNLGSIDDENEDQYWYGVKERPVVSLRQDTGMLSYPIGGFYLLRERDAFTFIRCGRHRDRPVHADNLHIDVWVRGENVLRDSGSYKYNTEKEFQEYFSGTSSHNTVMVGHHSQMMKGSRFIWFYWSQARQAEWHETDREYVFNGAISAFRFINPKAVHLRTVVKKKNELQWKIIDRVEGLPKAVKTQLWHHDGHKLNITAFADEHGPASAVQCKSYSSRYYGVKEEGCASAFAFNSEILTTLEVAD